MKMGPEFACLGVFVLCSMVYCQGPGGPSFSSGVSVGTIDNGELNDVSGCAASRVFPDIIYAHNDHGDSARIFAVNTTDARVVAVFSISSASHNDWEDIAVGPCDRGSPESCIYILDGGQANGFDARTIYKVKEPSALDNETLGSDYLLYDWAEPEACTIMVDPEATVYLISRVVGGRGMIASIEAGYWGQSTAVFLDSGAYFSMVSTHHDPNGGDISPDGREILVKNREEAYYFVPEDGNVLATLTHHGLQVPVETEKYGEAICWAADASAYYTLAEGHNKPLYKYTRN